MALIVVYKNILLARIHVLFLQILLYVLSTALPEDFSNDSFVKVKPGREIICLRCLVFRNGLNTEVDSCWLLIIAVLARKL